MKTPQQSESCLLHGERTLPACILPHLAEGLPANETPRHSQKSRSFFHQLLTALALGLWLAPITSAVVPASINYQGRLTDASGVPQSGTRAMSLKIHDAATAGTLLYAETIGNVTVDANGVYGFQFGAAGTSNSLVTETLATTDGTALAYQKTLGNTPVIAGSVSVTDGTFSWNELTGNPGSPASATATIVSGFVVGATVTSGGSGYTSAPAVAITGNGSGANATATVSGGAVTEINITNAGSGYTTGAPITIAPPPAPFTVNYTGGSLTATYATAPTAGQSITATYRYSASGISGALAAGTEQWLELSVDGAAQSPRQKVLAVPFAARADVATTALDAVDSQARLQLGYMLTSISAGRVVELSKALLSKTNYSGGLVQASASGFFQTPGSATCNFQISPDAGSSETFDRYAIRPSQYIKSGWYEIEYSDGQVLHYDITSTVAILVQNPNPLKKIACLRGSVNSPGIVAEVTATIFTPDRSIATYTISNSPTVPRGAFTVFSSNGSPILDIQLTIGLQDGRTVAAEPGFFIDLGSPIVKITVSATSPAFDASFSTIKLHY